MTNYEGRPLCGVDDRSGAMGQVCRWPSLDITWSITGQLPGIDAETFRAVCQQAWDAWSKVCGIRPKFVTGPSNLAIGIQTIGPGGVLADCQLPCGATMQSRLKMRVDTAEAWVIADNPPPTKVDLLRVLIHELGHGIGIPHISDENLMAPTYSSRIRRPMAGDEAEAVRRYGLPTGPTITPPSGDGFRELFALLEKGGTFYTRRNGVMSPL